MDLGQEIENHIQWIETIASLLSNEGYTEEDLAEISEHHNCDLGHWMDSEESNDLKHLDEFKQLEQSHQAFHKLAAKMLDALQQGNENLILDAEEDFIAMSQQVISHIQLLQDATSEN